MQVQSSRHVWGAVGVASRTEGWSASLHTSTCSSYNRSSLYSIYIRVSVGSGVVA